MTWRLFLLPSLVFMISCPCASATAPVPDDFSYGMLLQTVDGGALYRLDLVADVYQSTVTPRLTDLGVFNDRGVIVPHTIRRPYRAPAQTTRMASLPFFPLPAAKAGQSDMLSLHLRANQTDRVVKFESSSAVDRNERVAAYVIDASSLTRPALQLKLKWSQKSDTFIASVSLEHSDELANWQPLVANTTLAELNYSGHRLGNYSIDLPGKHGKYLKLSWPAEVGGAILTEVEAILALPADGSVVAWHWQDLSAPGTGDGRTFEFDSGGRFPVESVNISLPPENMVLQAILQSRDSAKDPWRKRGSGLFYHLREDGVVLRNKMFSVPLTRDRYWRVDIAPAGSWSGLERLHLRLGWTPDELVFVAQGPQPFTLAFGRAAADLSHQGEVEPMFATLESVRTDSPLKKVTVVKRMALGGKNRLLPPSQPLPWKVWLLWSVLIGCVLLLGWMAWRLYRQMN